MNLTIMAIAITFNSNSVIFGSCVIVTSIIAFGKKIYKKLKFINHKYNVIEWNDDDFYITNQDVDGDDL